MATWKLIRHESTHDIIYIYICHKDVRRKIKINASPLRVWRSYVHGATISLPGHNEHERMRGLYQTGYKGVGYVNHARVACNVTGLFARAGSLPKCVHARSRRGGEEVFALSMD